MNRTDAAAYHRAAHFAQELNYSLRDAALFANNGNEIDAAFRLGLANENIRKAADAMGFTLQAKELPTDAPEKALTAFPSAVGAGSE